jgi:hypothetical protein
MMDTVRRNLPVIAGPLMSHSAVPGIKPWPTGVGPWQYGAHIDSLPKQPPQEYDPKIRPPVVVTL